MLVLLAAMAMEIRLLEALMLIMIMAHLMVVIIIIILIMLASKVVVLIVSVLREIVILLILAKESNSWNKLIKIVNKIIKLLKLFSLLKFYVNSPISRVKWRNKLKIFIWNVTYWRKWTKLIAISKRKYIWKCWLSYTSEINHYKILKSKTIFKF